MRRALVLVLVGIVGYGCGDDGDGGSDQAGGSAGTGAQSSGGAATGGSAGSGGAGASGGSAGASGGTGGATGGTGGATGGTGGGACFDAKRLWFDDFETGDYSRWTSQSYDKGFNGGLCHDNGFSTTQAVSPTHSHRSEITCAISQSHRGYGGLQFSGDSVVKAYTNTGTGIDAPHGVVNTYYSRLEVAYPFQNGKWFSFWTVNNDCGWKDQVITLGLEDTTNRLTPAHIKSTGGTVERPGLPQREVGANHHLHQLPHRRDGRLAGRREGVRRQVHPARQGHLPVALGRVRQQRQRRTGALRRRQQHLEVEPALDQLRRRAVLRRDAEGLQPAVTRAPNRANQRP
jgi:hypothetical protein